MLIASVGTATYGVKEGTMTDYQTLHDVRQTDQLRTDILQSMGCIDVIDNKISLLLLILLHALPLPIFR